MAFSLVHVCVRWVWEKEEEEKRERDREVCAFHPTWVTLPRELQPAACLFLLARAEPEPHLLSRLQNFALNSRSFSDIFFSTATWTITSWGWTRTPVWFRWWCRRSRGTNGAKKWTFFCQWSVLLWIWGTCGDFLTSATKTAEVKNLFVWE